MTQLNLSAPLTFEPIFMERIWGGRRLESEFGKGLPAQVKIGESWEIVDREEAQSIVRDGPLQGQTLHQLWTNHRDEIFGALPGADRFPLLIKLLDAREKLSLQVHPPAAVAQELGGEPKTEFWYVAAAEAGAELLVGLREPVPATKFKEALDRGTVADHVHAIPVKAGDAMFLPSGRFHAIGSGNLLVEVQQNSDTTYRVFDWNRLDDAGRPRTLHVEEALRSIDFNDARPQLSSLQGEVLIRDSLFEIQKWSVAKPREIAPAGQFAIVFCLEGEIDCARTRFKPGEFFLVPAQMTPRSVEPVGRETTLLRITIPR